MGYENFPPPLIHAAPGPTFMIRPPVAPTGVLPSISRSPYRGMGGMRCHYPWAGSMGRIERCSAIAAVKRNLNRPLQMHPREPFTSTTSPALIVFFHVGPPLPHRAETARLHSMSTSRRRQVHRIAAHPSHQVNASLRCGPSRTPACKAGPCASPISGISTGHKNSSRHFRRPRRERCESSKKGESRSFAFPRDSRL